LPSNKNLRKSFYALKIGAAKSSPRQLVASKKWTGAVAVEEITERRYSSTVKKLQALEKKRKEAKKKVRF